MDLDHGNGRSNYSRTDGNGNNKQSGKHQELDPSRNRNNGSCIMENGSNKQHSTRHLEHDDEAGSSEHSSEVSGSFKNLRRYLELDAETGSSNQSDTHSVVIKLWENKHNKTPSDTNSSKQSEVIQEDEDRIEGEKLISSSSSSSDLSTDNMFQVDLRESKTISDPKPEDNDMQLQPFRDKHDVPGNNSSKLEECQSGDASLILTSEVSSVTDEPTLLQSPPVQMMGRVGELDTYKIPSVVFARSESITKVDDWSLPSSESLFSIRLDTGSFARDHIVSSNSGQLFKSGEFSADPLVPVQDTDEKGCESDKREETSVPDDDVRDKADPSIEEPFGKKSRRPMISWNSATIAHHSLDRVTTAPSIAFPERNNKKKKKKKKYVWPSCNCSSCWLAVCRSWNCTILPEETCFTSKEKEQKQQQKELSMASSIPSKSARCNCSSCFSSCRWHWCCGCNCCSRTL